MAYIDGTFLDNTFGSGNVTALCPTTTERDAVITMAEAAVYTAVYSVGYQTDSAPGDVTPATTPDTVQLLAYRVWIELAHLRKTKPVPDALLKNLPKLSDLENDEKGRPRIEIPDWTKNVTAALGGVSKTDVTSDRSDGGRENVFAGDKMTGWF